MQLYMLNWQDRKLLLETNGLRVIFFFLIERKETINSVFKTTSLACSCMEGHSHVHMSINVFIQKSYPGKLLRILKVNSF